MQISSSSAATSSMALSALRELFQTPTTEATGQISPTGEVSKSEKGRPPPPPPPPSSGSGTDASFSTDTLSALLQTQESGSGAASDAIDEADTNGDGTVSLAELAASLGTDEATVSKAFSKVDSDADGQITVDELDAGLKEANESRRPHGPPPPASEVASNLLTSTDSDQNGSLSLGEISSALGQDDQTALTDAFASLDTNGDGGLGSDELTSAIESIFARQMAAYAANTGSATTASRSLAA